MKRQSQKLFSDERFSEYQRDKRDEMQQEIEGLSSTELENSTDSLALIFVTKFTPSTIQLHEERTEDVGQIKKTTERLGPSRNLPGGAKVTKKFQRLKLKIKYSGEKALLLKLPQRTTRPLPTYDELTENEIVHYVDYQVKGKDAEEIKEKIDSDISKWKKRLKREVEHLNRDIQRMQGEFEDRARRYIETQRENMKAKNEALSELGISTQNTDQGFVEPEKKKDLELPDLEDGGDRRKIRGKTFVNILDIIDSMKMSVERSKSTVRELDEESLRDIFLGAINSHYGSATGESFNRGGKTDILLRHDNVNLFISECKFWRGKSQFQDAIDQLLGNLTADDSHASLLIFSDREELAQVRNRISEEVNKHEEFQKALSQFKNHDVYQFRKPSGTDVKVAIKVVDLSS